MNGPENTSKRPNELHLLGMLSEGQTGYIEGMEAAGQRQLVNSDRLPVDTTPGDLAEWKALGFTFGEPDPNDPMFRAATLPVGWSRQPTDHSMWSKLVDEHGRERVSIFYKAAFYDRSAFMRLVTPGGYMRSCFYDKTAPVFDEVWLTPVVADEALTSMRNYESSQAQEMRDHAAEKSRTEDNRAALLQYAREHDAKAAEIDAFRLAVQS
jgi:hypothetical protein